MLPDTLQELQLVNTDVETLENIPNTLSTLHLFGNTKLKTLHFPSNLSWLDMVNQHIDIVTIPPQLESLTLTNCVFNRINNINALQYTSTSMYIHFIIRKCTCPYQEDLDMYVNNNMENTMGYVRACNMSNIIKNINYQLDLDWINSLAGIQHKVRCIYNPNSITYAEQVMSLSSNYPRRLMEYMLDPSDW